MTARPRAIWPWGLLGALLLTALVYSLGLHGGYIFDDFRNIVGNPALDPRHLTWRSLLAAALSSPSSLFRRPLASLTFLANAELGGLNPFGFKVVNLAIHLCNGVLVCLLTRRLLAATATGPDDRWRNTVAVLIAAGWLWLPINLTAVLYVIERQESMAATAVLLGLIGYTAARQRQQRAPAPMWPAWIWLATCTGVGFLAKETAAMTPFFAALIEVFVFRFASAPAPGAAPRADRRLPALFLVLLVIPGLAGLAWLLPGVLNHATWASRRFDLGQRLLTEMRVVVDYGIWTLFPTPSALSFYHDNFSVSTGLLSPWTTTLAAATLAALLWLMGRLRRTAPLAALGIALFLGAQLMTATLIPLELVFEHRNYLASMGLLWAVLPFLAAVRPPLRILRGGLLAILMAVWLLETAQTAWAWDNPMRLAEQLVIRNPTSPRAEYDLSWRLMAWADHSHSTRLDALALRQLRATERLPHGSILPEQGLLLFSAQHGWPLDPVWWTRLRTILRRRVPSLDDASALNALASCAESGHCAFPVREMMRTWDAALARTPPRASILEMASLYAARMTPDPDQAMAWSDAALRRAPGSVRARVNAIHVAALTGHPHHAQAAWAAMTVRQRLHLDASIRARLRACLATPPGPLCR